MKEYDLFTRMLSQEFLTSDQQKMDEPKQGGKHSCIIVDKGVDQYKAYRYDLDNSDFLPFFNKDHDDEATGYVSPNPTPEGLRKFSQNMVVIGLNGSKMTAYNQEISKPGILCIKGLRSN